MGMAAESDPGYRRIVELFERGEYEAMYFSARDFLAAQPAHGRAWHMCGLAALICGQNEIAGDALQRAAELESGNPEVWDHLGTAHNFLGRLAEAERCFRRSIELDGARAETWVNAGKNFKDLGQREAAWKAYTRAAELKPGLTEAHNNLGVILLEERRHDEAVEAFKRAIAANPGYAMAHNNLGSALNALGRCEEARQACRTALDLDPNNAMAWNNLGNAQHDLGDNSAALESYRQAVLLAPEDAELRNNLGSALLTLKQERAAVEAFREAIRLRPDYVEAWNHLGNALSEVSDKLAAFRQALAIDPTFAEGRSNLLFYLQYLPTTAAGFLDEANAYGEILRRRGRPRTAWPNERQENRRLKVGLVSADLRGHPVGFFLASILEAIDREGFDFHAYYNNRIEDDWTQRFRAVVPNWRSIVGQADDVVAERIAADGIDLLIDLSGHTMGNRLPIFALRPAPVQLSWIGFFGTTGVPGMDYLIADPWGIRPGEEGCYTETVWRLPETRLCFTPPPSVPIGPLPQLAGNGITFGCFNVMAKINDAVVALWAEILHAVPDSRLLVKNDRVGDTEAAASLRRRFFAHGIAGDRVLCEGKSPHAEYLAAFNRVDVSLDPFPYPGGTTSADSLWMGVPVLTLTGETVVARQGEGILQNAGLPAWIAHSPQQYRDKAVAFAADRMQLSELRANLRARLRVSPLLDAPRFARFFETAMRGMWADWCRQQSNGRVD